VADTFHATIDCALIDNVAGKFFHKQDRDAKNQISPRVKFARSIHGVLKIDAIEIDLNNL